MSRSHLVALPTAAVREAWASVRLALWPVARLHPLPEPTGTRPPVVMVHGYLGHAEMFRPLSRSLLGAGWGRIVRVRYPSTRLSLEQIVERIATAAAPLSGPVDLVGHSLGAVACRAWLKLHGGSTHVRRFVSLGGPHGGTVLYRLTPPQIREVLDPDGPWVARLAAGPEPVPTTIVRARYDQQVLPPRRVEVADATEVVLDGIGHNGLIWDRRAHQAVADALR